MNFAKHRARLLFYTATVGAVALVLGVYLFFATAGRFRFRTTTWDASHYANLAQGFLHGHLSLASTPDERLAALPDPYAYTARAQIPYLWDASYFRGRYYLYFSPVPVVLFYLPFRVLSGASAPDNLAATLFTTWAFLAYVAFAWRAMEIGWRKPLVPFPLWVLLIGIGNVIPFMLSASQMYLVAIVAGMAMTGMWANALLSFYERGAARDGLLVGLWLGLAIASRPNLILLLPVSAFAIYERRKERRAAAAAFVAPLALIASVEGLYNYARFGSPLEIGIRYQLNDATPGVLRCGIHNVRELGRFINTMIQHIVWPPFIDGSFPFVHMLEPRLDAAVMYSGAREQTIGIGSLVPLTIAGLVCAALLFMSCTIAQPQLRASLLVLLGGWSVLLGLSACWWITARFTLDFTSLIVVASIVFVEHGLDWLASVGVRTAPLRVAAVALACYSIAVGLMLGLSGPDQAFPKANLKLYLKIAKPFEPMQTR